MERRRGKGKVWWRRVSEAGTQTPKLGSRLEAGVKPEQASSGTSSGEGGLQHPPRHAEAGYRGGGKGPLAALSTGMYLAHAFPHLTVPRSDPARKF